LILLVNYLEFIFAELIYLLLTDHNYM